jgi:hypothetical protein
MIAVPYPAHSNNYDVANEDMPCRAKQKDPSLFFHTDCANKPSTYPVFLHGRIV